MNAHVGNLVPNFRETSDIKWNFTKFLVDRKGNVVARFEPTADMADVEKANSRITLILGSYFIFCEYMRRRIFYGGKKDE